jgi:hypothetical protein
MIFVAPVFKVLRFLPRWRKIGEEGGIGSMPLKRSFVQWLPQFQPL